MSPDPLTEAKELVAGVAGKNCNAAIVDLTLAVQILIGLVEGHRHTYVKPATAVGVHLAATGPMQAMEGK